MNNNINNNTNTPNNGTINNTDMPNTKNNTIIVNTVQDDRGPLLTNSETIGNVKKDTQKSPVAMLILFSVLIICIYLVPEITPYFSNILSIFGIEDNSSAYTDNSSNTTTNNNKKEEDTPTNNTTYYDIVDTTTINYDNLTINNIKKESDGTNYYLVYTIINNNTSSYSFTNNKIYFDIYDSNKTYLDRLLISTSSLNSNSSIELKSYLTEEQYNNASIMEVLKRSEEDYSDITIKSNKLTCTNNTHTTVYTFSSKKLTYIDDTYTYISNNTDTTYATYYLNMQTLTSDLTKKTGVSGGIVSTGDYSFIRTLKINYSETSDNFLTYELTYYPKDTLAKTIKYELESLDYKCE